MNPATQVTAYVSGVSALLILWILYRLYNGSWSIKQLIEGADGHPSTSKLQWFLWTVVVLFSYVVLYAAQAANGNFDPIINVPDNLLIAMGISSFSMVAAKGITVSQVQSGQIVKPQATPGTATLGSVLKDDAGYPDLSKIQILAWTFIAIVVFLVQIFNAVRTPSTATPYALVLPDIGSSLMILMGLGHGAYLGKKLVSTSSTGQPAGGVQPAAVPQPAPQEPTAAAAPASTSAAADAAPSPTVPPPPSGTTGAEVVGDNPATNPPPQGG